MNTFEFISAGSYSAKREQHSCCPLKSEMLTLPLLVLKIQGNEEAARAQAAIMRKNRRTWDFNPRSKIK